jgi:hypothetical protein
MICFLLLQDQLLLLADRAQAGAVLAKAGMYTPLTCKATEV